MKLSLTINQEASIIAELDSPGHLGAHINMRKRDGETEVCDANISGYDVSDKKCTQFHKWPRLDLKPGDSIKIQIDPEDTATPPSSIEKSSEVTEYQNRSIEDAKVALEVVHAHIKSLHETLELMRSSLSEEDFKTFARNVGHTLYAYHENIERPIYRNHPSLVPDALKGSAL